MIIAESKFGYINFEPCVREAGIGDFKHNIAKLLNGNCEYDDYLTVLRFSSLIDRLYEQACVKPKSTAVRLAENLTRRAYNGQLRQ